jgi:hypothetical protein
VTAAGSQLASGNGHGSKGRPEHGQGWRAEEEFGGCLNKVMVVLLVRIFKKENTHEIDDISHADGNLAKIEFETGEHSVVWKWIGWT